VGRPESCRFRQTTHGDAEEDTRHAARRLRERNRPGPAAGQHDIALYVWLVAITGVRRGELCAVQIADIDLSNGVIRIAFNYVVKVGQKLRKDTKTHQERHIAIDPVTCALIQETLDETTRALAAVGVTLAPSAFLFSNDPAHSRRGTPTG
jgi:integrase